MHPSLRLLPLALLLAGCAAFDEAQVNPTPGPTQGAGGASAGAAGTATAGQSGSAGQAGSAGGTAGQGGSAGASGKAGASGAGQAGAGQSGSAGATAGGNSGAAGISGSAGSTPGTGGAAAGGSGAGGGTGGSSAGGSSAGGSATGGSATGGSSTGGSGAGGNAGGAGGAVGGTCGDGALQPGEECDDGNSNDGDGCTPGCKFVCQGPNYHLDPSSGRCYFLSNNSLSWGEARAACLALGPGFDLATPSTLAELNFVSSIEDDAWIGGQLQRHTGAFVWVNGEAWGYLPGQPPWDAGEPGNETGLENCVELTNKDLNDQGCQQKQRYLCERPPAGAALCRNGVVEAGEECDDGNTNASDGCNLRCLVEVCGDGKIQGDEPCDDGNLDNTDDCSNTCQLNCQGPGYTRDEATGRCYYFANPGASGKGLSWGEARQACFLLGPGFDLAAPSTTGELNFIKPLTQGENTWLGGRAEDPGQFAWSNGESWNYTSGQSPWKPNNPSPFGSGYCVELETTGLLDDEPCQADKAYLCERPPLTGPLCRDGVQQANEACDDGNLDSTDTCTSACELPACGDGFAQPSAGEECDDGDTSNTDVCLNSCKLPKCGDGYVQNGVEQCDDGNLLDGDGCQGDCTTVCGDGIIVPPEQCEDGNQINTDSCTNACRNAACRDGYVQAGEACDDGNLVNGDGCENDCTLTP